jgi:hypothetical protein
MYSPWFLQHAVLASAIFAGDLGHRRNYHHVVGKCAERSEMFDLNDKGSASLIVIEPGLLNLPAPSGRQQLP